MRFIKQYSTIKINPIKFVLLFLILASSHLLLHAQVGIGVTNPDVSAILELKSSDKGFLLPRLSLNEIQSIANPANALMVYNIDDNLVYLYIEIDNQWKALQFGSETINTGTPLNQAANWPNANWSISGTYATGSGIFEGNPTIGNTFAFDDNEAGNGSDTYIIAASPIIDLTDTFNAGKVLLNVSGNYNWNNLNTLEILEIEYYNADTGNWVDWYHFTNADTTGAPTDNFNNGPFVNYTTSDLDISSFTATQLSGFKYRFAYDDADAWANGFGFESPSISAH